MCFKINYALYKRKQMQFFVCFSFRATLIIPLWMPWSIHEGKRKVVIWNNKEKNTWIFFYIKYGQFWSILMEKFCWAQTPFFLLKSGVLFNDLNYRNYKTSLCLPYPLDYCFTQFQKSKHSYFSSSSPLISISRVKWLP